MAKQTGKENISTFVRMNPKAHTIAKVKSAQAHMTMGAWISALILGELQAKN